MGFLWAIWYVGTIVDGEEHKYTATWLFHVWMSVAYEEKPQLELNLWEKKLITRMLHCLKSMHESGLNQAYIKQAIISTYPRFHSFYTFPGKSIVNWIYVAPLVEYGQVICQSSPRSIFVQAPD